MTTDVDAERGEPTEHDLIDVGAKVLRTIGELGFTVAVAESLTGGQISSVLVGSPGSSSCFRGGVVAYATDVKRALLNVDADLLANGGPVQPEVARQMAENVATLLGADIGIGTTGVAGPHATEDGPAGLVYIGVSAPNPGSKPRRQVWTQKFWFKGKRNEVRRQVVEAAFAMVLDRLAAQ